MKRTLATILAAILVFASIPVQSVFAETTNSYAISYKDVDNENSLNLIDKTETVTFDAGNGSLGDVRLQGSGGNTQVYQNEVLKATLAGAVVQINAVYQALGATPVTVNNYQTSAPTLNVRDTMKSFTIPTGITVISKPPTQKTDPLEWDSEKMFIVTKERTIINGSVRSSVAADMCPGWTFYSNDVVLVSGGEISGTGSFGPSAPSYGGPGHIYVFADALKGLTPIMLSSSPAQYMYSSGTSIACTDSTSFIFKGGECDMIVRGVGASKSGSAIISYPKPSNILIVAKSIKGRYTTANLGDGQWTRDNGSLRITGEIIDAEVLNDTMTHSPQNNTMNGEFGYGTYAHTLSASSSDVFIKGQNVTLRKLQGEQGNVPTYVTVSDGYNLSKAARFGSKWFSPRVYGSSVFLGDVRVQGVKAVADTITVNSLYGFNRAYFQNYGTQSFSTRTDFDAGTGSTGVIGCGASAEYKSLLKANTVTINGTLDAAFGRIIAAVVNQNVYNVPANSWWSFKGFTQNTHNMPENQNASNYSLRNMAKSDLFGCNTIELTNFVNTFKAVSETADVKVFKAKSVNGVPQEAWREVYSSNIAMTGSPEVKDKTTAVDTELSYYTAFRLANSDCWIHNLAGNVKIISQGPSTIDTVNPEFTKVYYGSSVTDKAYTVLDLGAKDNMSKQDKLRMNVGVTNSKGISFMQYTFASEMIGARTLHILSDGGTADTWLAFKDYLRMPLEMGDNTFVLKLQDESDNGSIKVFRIKRVETLSESRDVIEGSMLNYIRDNYTGQSIARKDTNTEVSMSNPYACGSDSVTFMFKDDLSADLGMNPTFFRYTINGAAYGDYLALSTSVQEMLDGVRKMNVFKIKFYDYDKNEMDLQRYLYVENSKTGGSVTDGSIKIPSMPTAPGDVSDYLDRVKIIGKDSAGSDAPGKLISYNGRYAWVVREGLISINLNHANNADFHGFSTDGVNYSENWTKTTATELMLPKSGLNLLTIRPASASGVVGAPGIYLVIVDDVEPSVVVKPVNGKITLLNRGSNNVQQIYGKDNVTTMANLEYRINGAGAWTKAGSGTLNLPVAAGLNTYSIEIRDEAGNVKIIDNAGSVWGK